MKKMILLILSLSMNTLAFADSSSGTKYLCTVNYVYSGQGPSRAVMQGRISANSLSDDTYVYTFDTSTADSSVVS